MEDKILAILEDICEDSVVRENGDLDLFEEELLDSLGFAELLVNLEDELGIVIGPSEVTREEMNTPNKIVALVMQRA